MMNTCREYFNISFLVFLSLIKIIIICAVYSPIPHVRIDYKVLSSISKPSTATLKNDLSESELLSKTKRKYFDSTRKKLSLLSSTYELEPESEELTQPGYFISDILNRANNKHIEQMKVPQNRESSSSITPQKRKTKTSENDEKPVRTILDPYGVGENDISDSSNLPVFLTEPESTYVVRNRPAILKCKAVHSLQLQFKCSGSSQPPPSSYEKHVDPRTGAHLEEVTATITRDLVDEYFGRGPFKCECQAWSSKGVIKSQAAFINVSYIRKQFLTSPTSLRVGLGSKVTLDCVPPVGSPTPRIAWLKNNAVFDIDMKGITASKGILTFNHVSLQDMANYTCTAENISGKRTSDTAVVIVYVNGGWSSWSSWIDCKCSESGSQGKKRIRSCNNPVPLNGGELCSGPQIQKSLDCISCTEIDWALYLGLFFVTVVCLIFGAVLISCARRGIDNNIPITTTNSKPVVEKKSNHINLDSIKINYEYILEHNCTADKNNISCGMSEPHYDVPNLSASYINPFDEISMNYLPDATDSPNSASKSTYGIPNKLHSMSLLKKSVSKFNITSNIFNRSGGRLRLYDGEIMLYIPNLAISKNQKINVTLMVLSEETENMSVVSENVIACSAIIHCSPSEYNFLKPAILKIPHCLTNRDQWNVMIYHSENHCDDVNVAWRMITIVGQETINTPVFSQLDPSHAYLMTEQLGRYAIVADPKPDIPISEISIRMKLFAFIQMTPNTSILRIYVVRDFPYSRDTCSHVETKLGGTFLAESSSFKFHFNNGNLLIRVRPFDSEAWVLPLIEEQEQVIPYAHIISNNSVLHCEFSLKQTDQNCMGADLDVGFMQGNSDNIEKHIRCAISNRYYSHLYETTNTVSTLDSRGHIVNDIVALDTSQLPPLTKRKICAALDPPRTDENDWRLLASKLNTDRYIAYFATKSSPTEQILNLLECRANNSSNVIAELLLTLKDMNRPDVVRIIEQNIEKQWI